VIWTVLEHFCAPVLMIDYFYADLSCCLLSGEVEARVRVWGSESGVTARLAPCLGPIGVNSGQVGQNVAKATEGFKGFCVTVEIKIVGRQATVGAVPSTSTLIVKAFNELHRDSKKTKNVKHPVSLTLGTVTDIARTMRAKLIAKTLSRTAQAMGAQCEGQNSKLLQRKIANGEIPIHSE
jgi:large subunit ribosomal protein L12e